MTSRCLPALAACLAAVLIASPAFASDAHFNPPKQYYVALGDSLSFGYQDQKFKDEIASGTYTPASFNTGFVDHFGARLQTISPDIRIENFGCPGETTVTFVDGGCQFHAALPLRVDYPSTTPQLQAALAFLRAHPGQAGPITLDVGANDALNALQACQPTNTCTAVVVTLSALINHNLAQILASIRRASPSSEVIVLTLYDPFVVLSPPTLTFTDTLNQAIRSAATAAGARVADVADLATPENWCQTTLMCTPDKDIHPSDLGYGIMADRVWQASGYDRLPTHAPLT